MKKSEMLAQLYADVDKFIDEGTSENMVDFILRRVEELGMLPPDYEYYNDNPESTQMWFTVNKWEPEEEGMTNEELLASGQCPCGSDNSKGCNITGCPLACYKGEFDENK